MSNDNDFERFSKNLKRLINDIPQIMNSLAVGEGEKVVKEAKKITNEEQIYASRNYKRSWHSDDKAVVSGTDYIVKAGNTAEYAEYIEKGFRSHFVPGHWENDVFVYDKNSKTGMIVGSYKIVEQKCENGRVFKRAVPYGIVPGRRVLKRSIDITEATQKARLERKFEAILKKRGLK